MATHVAVGAPARPVRADREIWFPALAFAACVLLAFFPLAILYFTGFRIYLHWPWGVRAGHRALELFFPGDLVDMVRRRTPAGGKEQLGAFLFLAVLAVAALRGQGISGRVRTWVLTAATGACGLAALILTGADTVPAEIAALFATIAGAAVFYLYREPRIPWADALRVAAPVGLTLEAVKLAVVAVVPSLRVPLEIALGPFSDFVVLLAWSFAAAALVLAGARFEGRLSSRLGLAAGVPLAAVILLLAGAHISGGGGPAAAHGSIPVTAPQVRDYEPRAFAGTFSSAFAPVMHINPGDTVRTMTLDDGGYDAHQVQRTHPINPQTGPFYVEGAEPGDTLAIRIVKLALNRDHAGSSAELVPNALTSEYLDGAVYGNDALEEWRLDRQAGFAMLMNPTPKTAGLRIPLRPLLGCVAVAPPGTQAIPTNELGPWGGNLDYREIRVGATLYLPVFHKGALLFVGDGHAAQGDGEIGNVALETSLDIEFTVALRPGEHLEGPRVENETSLMAMGIDRSLPVAVRKATTALVQWIETTHRLTAPESAVAVSHAIRYDIAEIANPQANVVARIDKNTLAGLR